MFWNFIDDCCGQEDYVIGIKKISVVGKIVIWKNKSSASGKISAVGKEWFWLLLLAIK